MKKIIYLLLCLLLVGCGTKDISENTYIITINPKVMIYENTKSGEITRIEPLNDDAETYFKDLDITNKKLSDVVLEMVDICVDEGLINESNHNVSIVSMQEENTLYQEEMNVIKSKITTQYNDVIINEGHAEENSDEYIQCTYCKEGRIVCSVCQGRWDEGIDIQPGEKCSRCNNGYITEERLVNVYNGTPCHICHDVGTVDDGMHGGLRAERGECRGYGSRHKVGDLEGQEGYNGDYRNYAFDEVRKEVKEECPDCQGTGKLNHVVHYDQCTYCNRGYLVCPMCDGEGGWNLHHNGEHH